jgi:uncharacterized membrane protein YbaN (DUF454 family)
VTKHLRISVGALLVATGIILFILPGSMLFVLLGLAILSYDLPKARAWLRNGQIGMSRAARKLDKMLYERKFRG